MASPGLLQCGRPEKSIQALINLWIKLRPLDEDLLAQLVHFANRNRSCFYLQVSSGVGKNHDRFDGNGELGADLPRQALAEEILRLADGADRVTEVFLDDE